MFITIYIHCFNREWTVGLVSWKNPQALKRISYHRLHTFTFIGKYWTWILLLSKACHICQILGNKCNSMIHVFLADACICNRKRNIYGMYGPFLVICCFLCVMRFVILIVEGIMDYMINKYRKLSRHWTLKHLNTKRISDYTCTGTLITYFLLTDSLGRKHYCIHQLKTNIWPLECVLFLLHSV